VPYIATQIDPIITGTMLGNKRGLVLKQRAGEQFGRMMEQQSENDFDKANVSK
jgi:hypothetical protein